MVAILPPDIMCDFFFLTPTYYEHWSRFDISFKIFLFWCLEPEGAYAV